MASYNQVSLGSQGNDVKELQTLLNKNGYNLDVDGIFGSATQQAVKDYQKKNGLSVDGIAGTNTWGSLTGSNANNAANTIDAPKVTTPTFSYTPSATTNAAQKSYDSAYADLQDYDQYKAGTYEQSKYLQELWDQANSMQKPTWEGGQWSQNMIDAMNAYINRDDFSYDLNGDALYQQYKDKYVQQGKMAMMDTMGQAAALTGGYGNSYASTAGNQAYQAHLQNLNDIVPELYQMAYDRYNQEGENMLNAYSLYKDQYDTEYGQYRDSVSDFNTERANLLNMYGIKSDEEYGQWSDAENRRYDEWKSGYDQLADLLGVAHGRYNNEKSFDYSSQKDTYDSKMTAQDTAKSDVYAAIQTGVMPSDAMLNAAGIDKSTAQAMVNVYKKQLEASGSLSGGSSSGGSNSGGSSSASDGDSGSGSNNPYGFTTEEVKTWQKTLGVTVDGVWGPKTQAAYDAYQNGGIDDSKDDYADWTAAQWRAYFASIRKNGSQSEAETELKRMIEAGYIPKDMVAQAAIGARGTLGH